MEQENVQTVEKTENVDTQTTEQNEVKTFTQEEVNQIIKTRLRNIPSDDELKAYNDWKESQKTEAEKNAEVLKENESLKSRINELENMQVVANAGVDSKFQKFVFSEVSKEGNFEDNLKEYLKNNNQYLIKDEKTKTTGYSQNTSNLQISEEKAYLDKKYANNPYYKK